MLKLLLYCAKQKRTVVFAQPILHLIAWSDAKCLGLFSGKISWEYLEPHSKHVIEPLFVYCWAGVADGGPALNQ